MAVRVDKSVTEDVYRRYAFMRDNGHEEFLTKAEKCDRMVLGDHWDLRDKQRLQNERRPAITVNKTKSTIATLLGEQIQNRAEITFRPKNGAPEETAEALNKVWMQIAQNNQLNWVRSDVFQDGITRSRGFYDMRLNFDDSMRGEIQIQRMNSKNVLIDPDAVDYDPDEWQDVIVTKWVSLAEVAQLYGKDAMEHLKGKTYTGTYDRDMIEFYRDRFGGDSMRGISVNENLNSEGAELQGRRYRMLDRQYFEPTTREFFVDLQTGDMRVIPDSWERDKIAKIKSDFGLGVVNRLTKRIKWCVTIDDLVAFESWSPYKHFTVVPYFPMLVYGKTSGIVEHLIGPQELLNKSISQELHIINTSANSGWMVKQGGLRNMTIEQLEEFGAKTGLVLELDSIESAEKIQPNQVPTGIDRITFKAEEFMKVISNVSDSMQGFDREDVAAKAIAYKQQRGNVNFSKDFDNLERSDYILARNGLDIIQEFYTEERIINITHQDPTRSPEELTINQLTEDGVIANDLTIGEFDITIVSAPYRATLEDSQFEQALGMREAGVAIPDTVLVENSRLTRKTELMKQMAGDQESPEAMKKRELQMRQAEAEVVKLESEARERQAETELKMARTRTEINDGNPAIDPAVLKAQLDNQLERERMEFEMQMKREEMEQEAILEREKMEREFALEQEKMEREFALKRETMEREMAIKEAVAVKQAAAAEAQAKAAAQNPAAAAGGGKPQPQH